LCSRIVFTFSSKTYSVSEIVFTEELCFHLDTKITQYVGYYFYLPPYRGGWVVASHWVYGYSLETVYVESVLVRVAPSRFFCEHFDFTLPVTIPPVFHTLLLLPLRCSVGPVSQNIVMSTFIIISHLPFVTWNLAEEVI
jgi:hypothetical protein